MKQLIQLKEPIGEITNPIDLFNKIKKINIDYEQENLIAFYLNTKNQIINNEVVFKGGLNNCLIDPKTLFRKALLNNAYSIIIAHNHPSGSLKPSPEDIETTDTLKQAGDLISIQLLDQIIFNKKEFYSLLEGM